jgi:hypothetical protein
VHTVAAAAITAGAKDVGGWKMRNLHRFINKRYICEKQGYEVLSPLLSGAQTMAMG